MPEADNTNQIIRYYVHGLGLIAAITPADDVFTYHFDGNANTIAITDGSKTIVNKYRYWPFGEFAGRQEAFTQPFTYVGQYGVMREGNNMYYMRAISRLFSDFNGS